MISRKAEVLMLDEGDRVRSRFGVPYGAELHRRRRRYRGTRALSSTSGIRTRTSSCPTREATSGIRTLLDDVTVKEKIDEKTGKMQMVVIEDREKKHHPHLQVIDDRR